MDSELDELEAIINQNFRGERIDMPMEKDECITNEIIPGIDLGTTNSCISVWRNNRLEIIPDEKNNLTVPSVVAFSNIMRFIGIEAKNQSEINPKNTYYDIKRLMGKLFTDESVQADLEFLAYDVCTDKEKKIYLSATRGKKDKYTPEELSSMILTKLKTMAETYLKQNVSKVVVTVPAYFNDVQREATKNACTIAGLDCVRMINEPTASALAYGFIKNDKKESTILVYDLGGGTLDVSIMKLNIKNGVFQVLASNGNSHLGGSDFDTYLMNHCMLEFQKKHKIEKLVNIDPSSLQTLRKRCELTKKNLSTKTKDIIAVKSFYDDKDLCSVITREEFEKLCSSLFILCMKPVHDTLNSCDMKRSDIDEIILVGGSTRIPKIKQNLTMYFGKEPNDTVNPDIVVSAGAAVQGYLLSHTDDPFSSHITLLDVLPLSLGVETLRSMMTTIIPRNSVIPIKKTKRFNPDEDYLTSVSIKIFEGEHQLTKDNYFIGSFELNDLDPVLKELQEVFVTISVDFNGIIDVTAIDKRKEDNKQTVRITSRKNTISQDDINHMIKEAKEWELAEKIHGDIMKYRYEINDLCKTILSNIDTLFESDRKIIMKEVEHIQKWLSEDQHSYEDYALMLKNTRAQYGILALKKNTDTNKVLESSQQSTAGVSIFNTDKDEQGLYEKIELNTILSETLNEDEKKQLLETRDELMNTCYDILKIIKNEDIKLDSTDKNEIFDIVDDTLLWITVTEKASIQDYCEKLVKINEITNSIVKQDMKVFVTDPTQTTLAKEKKELEIECLAIQCSMEDSIFAVSEEDKQVLLSFIEDTLTWLQDGTDLELCLARKSCLHELCALFEKN